MRQFLRECDRSEYGVLEDAKFLDAMTEGTLRGNSKIKQFLLGVNRHGRPDAVVLRGTDCSVEHVLPVSADHWSVWRGFEKVEGGDWIHKIGNLTLMSTGDNKPGSKYNASFAKKRVSYENSSVAITRELAANDDWTPELLQARQRSLAEAAVSVWVFE